MTYARRSAARIGRPMAAQKEGSGSSRGDQDPRLVQWSERQRKVQRTVLMSMTHGPSGKGLSGGGRDVARAPDCVPALQTWGARSAWPPAMPARSSMRRAPWGNPFGGCGDGHAPKAGRRSVSRPATPPPQVSRPVPGRRRLRFNQSGRAGMA